MIGAIISAVGALGSSIVGGVSAARQRRQEQAEIERQRAANKAWRDYEYNQDATQRADAQRALTRLGEQIRKNNTAAQGRQAVMGGTEESVVATQQANSQAMADATSQIVANADARKDKIDTSYRAEDAALSTQQRALNEQKAQAITQATSQAIQAAGNMGAAIDSPVEGGDTTSRSERKAAAINQKNSITGNQLADQRDAANNQAMQSKMDLAAKAQLEQEKKKVDLGWRGNAWPS